MADIIFLNLPTFKAIKASELPEKASRPGIAFFVSNDDGTPLGVAVSKEDLSISFYSVMQIIKAADIELDINGIASNNVEGAISELYTEQAASQRIAYLRNLSGVI